jgi:hypothetical protein
MAQRKYVNYIVTPEGLRISGLVVSERVHELLEEEDELTWRQFLRKLHEAPSFRYDASMPDLFPY